VSRILFILSLVPSAGAPLVGRPREHFYGAVGERVRVELRALPTELSVEEPLTLTLVVHGADNAEALNRPDLKLLPEFASRFHIDDIADDGPPRSPRRFRYRLRPKNEHVRDVPPLLVHYYHPRLNYFATTASPEAIALKVSPRLSQSQYVPLDAPDLLFQRTDADELSAQPWSGDKELFAFLLALMLPPLAFQFLYLWWRRRNPSAARLAALRRSQAVRAALDALASATSPEQIAGIVRTFMRERIGMAHRASTPSEIAADLARLGVDRETVTHAATFFHACDAAKFAPPGASPAPPVAEAERLILALERRA